MIIILALAASCAVFLVRNKKNSVIILKNENAITAIENKKDNVQSSNSKSFFVSGWLPYWGKVAGADSLSRNLNLFTEINPFAYGVNPDGSLVDKMQISSAPWPELLKNASKDNVRIVPTILWGDAAAMHKVFTSSELLNSHIDAINEMLAKNNFSGVDIDYEGKDMADRDNFTLFLKALSGKLAAVGKSLNCTVEARAEENPPAGFSGTRAMSWANDYEALNNYCDTVRIMAYDQVFQTYRANTFESSDATPSAPNAGNDWVAAVMGYALRYITPEKLILGVPTYGWEFKLEKISQGYRYTRVKSVSFPEAMEKATKANVTPERNQGVELSFVYKNATGEDLVDFSDSVSVRQKIDLAKSLGIKGISLFKIDGLSDSKLFAVLKDEVSK